MNKKQVKILAIETSCDETAAAVVTGRVNEPVEILSHAVYSQIALHQQYGGVYPEAASREHIKKIGIVIEQALQEARGEGAAGTLQSYAAQEIDAIAVTVGPGLIGSLLVGVNAAKTLAYSFKKPIIGINHHEGHIMASFIGALPPLPALALVVSGGHTLLVLVKDIGEFELIGRTRDDAAGEAFDKVARLLDLPYPGGPQIAKLAKEFEKSGKKQHITLPRPMLDSGDFDFSFSGLKTAVARVATQESPLTQDKKRAIAAAFQEAVIDVLVQKTTSAIKMYQPQSVILCGGVAANTALREMLQQAVEKNCRLPFFVPTIALCTDNAAMVGAAAIYKLLANQVQNWYDISADDTLRIGEKIHVTRIA